jgi:HAD superfamily hydrolase (TIGR01509 family)
MFHDPDTEPGLAKPRIANSLISFPGFGAGDTGTMIRAVVFDLDGVLLDSEKLWDQARREVAARHEGRWRDEATTAMQGMSSAEWSRYMRDTLAVDLTPEQISDLVVAGLLERYRHGLPLITGAVEAVRRIAARWPLALASSANRVVIDMVLAVAGLSEEFGASVSSEEVPRGKPAPDVYLEAARRLGQPPAACAAVEDSASGIKSAIAAGMLVVAVPNRDYPPPGDILASAQLVLDSLPELTVDLLGQLSDGEPAS